jgi:hypothetical protein
VEDRECIHYKLCIAGALGCLAGLGEISLLCISGLWLICMSTKMATEGGRMDHGSWIIGVDLLRWMMALTMTLLHEARHGWGAGSAGPVLTEVDR